ncbi:MAG: hypothetical protein ACRC61_22610 [Aeromonas salmonicida]
MGSNAIPKNHPLSCGELTSLVPVEDNLAPEGPKKKVISTPIKHIPPTQIKQNGKMMELNIENYDVDHSFFYQRLIPSAT